MEQVDCHCAVFVGQMAGVSSHPQCSNQPIAVEYPYMDYCIADVNGQQHPFNRSSTRQIIRYGHL
jgi:hypothetical protein